MGEPDSCVARNEESHCMIAFSRCPRLEDATACITPLSSEIGIVIS